MLSLRPMNLAKRLSKIDEPQTIRMAKLSRELKTQGKDIIDLSLGEPDFKTPDHIIKAAKEAMDQGYTKYPPVAGFADVKQAVVDKFLKYNHLKYKLNEVMVSTGAKQCIYNTMMCLLNPGDEVIIPAPYWVTYVDIVKISEGTVVEVHGGFENEFKITPTQLANAITSKTKVFIFSSPCNPTGSIYSFEELEALAKVFAANPHVFIISDEIYEFINFVGKHESIAQFEAIKERVIVINGLSKAYAMTGWRLGYMAAHADIIKGCETLQSQSTSGANSITQRATIAALGGDMQPTYDMVAAFKERRDYLVEALKEIEGIKINTPPGAFYVFPDISFYLGKKDIETAEDFCMYLLNEAEVGTVTGEAFGNPHCMRISYATSLDKLQEAVKRIKLALEKLR